MRLRVRGRKHSQAELNPQRQAWWHHRGLGRQPSFLIATLSFHSYDICIYKNKPCGTLGTHAPRFLAPRKAVGWVALALVRVGTWQGGWGQPTQP